MTYLAANIAVDQIEEEYDFDGEWDRIVAMLLKRRDLTVGQVLAAIEEYQSDRYLKYVQGWAGEDPDLLEEVFKGD